MNKQKYLNDRAALLAEAQKLMEAGDQAGFDAKCKEIEALDASYEAYARNAANLSALEGAQSGSMANAIQNPTGAQRTAAADLSGNGARSAMTREELLASQAYHDAYFRHLTNADDTPTGEGTDAAEEFLHSTGMEIGRQIPPGISGGVEDAMPQAERDILAAMPDLNELMPEAPDPRDWSWPVPTPVPDSGTRGAQRTVRYGDIHITVTAEGADYDEEKLADHIAVRFREELDAKEL